MIKEFIKLSKITDPYEFSFVSVGYNLRFEHNFLLERCRVNDINPIDILNRPFIDLRALGIIMNQGNFKGSGLDKITGKKSNGSVIPQWYAEKHYDKIIDYIKNETEEFVKFIVWLYRELPYLLERFKKECNIS